MASAEEKAQREFDQAFDDMASLRVTRAELSRMPDGNLALWQAEHKLGSAEFILADHEWKIRRIVQQTRAIYGAAVLGIVGVVVGVILGWYLGSSDAQRPVVPGNQVHTPPESNQPKEYPQMVAPADVPKISPVTPPRLNSSGATQDNSGVMKRASPKATP